MKAITMAIARAIRRNTMVGFDPVGGMVVVVVAGGIPWPAGMSLGVGRMTAELEGGIPLGLDPA